jgi:hypothetical protein
MNDFVHSFQPEPPSRPRSVFQQEKSPFERLPAAAQEKLALLRMQAREANALCRIPFSDIEEAREMLGRIDAHIAEQRRLGKAESHPAVAVELAQRVEFSSKANKLATEYGRRCDVWNELAQQLSRIENFILDNARKAFLSAPPINAPAVDAGRIVDAVQAKRIEIAALRRNIQETIDAPRHSSAAKKVARAQIEELASRGAPDVMPMIESGGSFTFPLLSEIEFTPTMGSRYSTAVASDALLCWLFKKQMIVAVDAEIDANAMDAEALSDDERARLLALWRPDLLAAERLEEALIEAAAATGQTIARRMDADVRAILGLADQDETATV